MAKKGGNNPKPSVSPQRKSGGNSPSRRNDNPRPSNPRPNTRGGGSDERN